MTDLQPSPPGYRGQDEPPDPARSPSNPSFPIYGGGENYNPKQQQQPSVSPRSDFYHHHHQIHKNDANRKSSPPAVVVVSKNYQTDNNTGYKKNSPGYKNDSGYSESSGFGSYSLPLSERDEASPPPTPPVRDASSLKGVCYGPGHEKYPSWPSAPEHHGPEDDAVNGSVAAGSHGGSHRSKSWTDHTSYPKEKPAQYTRPHTKRPNPAFTQQLKTVMERCEKIPAETYEARNRNSAENNESRLWPRVDREGKSLGDLEYVAPSPPEREQQPQTLSHADLEAYVRSYQDPQVGQVELYQESALTQAGLEEYARVQHSQQASYAQSEGYHSYVSSVDSTTNTPFLDRLRRDSEAVAQRPSSSSWEDSREGRDSVVTTSSGSASSSETLKWHGSMSDVSVASGLPARQSVPDKWHHGSMSDVSLSSALPHKQSNNPRDNNNKWQGSLSDVSSMVGITNKIKNSHGVMNLKNDHQWKKEEIWQNSLNDRTKNAGRNAQINKKESSSPSPSAPAPAPTSATSSSSSSSNIANWQESNIDEERAEIGLHHNSVPMPQSSSLSPNQNTPNSNSLMIPPSPDNWNSYHGSMSDLSASGLQSSKQLIAHSARVQTPQRHHSESVLYLDRERGQRKIYNSGQASSPGHETAQNQRLPALSPQQPQLSVAERISELEKQQQQQQQMRYTYLDPDKRHRVSDPTLKAIQKKALLSFYERHHQASWRSEPQLAAQANLGGGGGGGGGGSTTPAPQSPPPQPPPRPRPPSSRRASSASDYASGGAWREKSTRSTANLVAPELPSPKHQHSSSCGSLSTDLLGPVIVGQPISIDDWVPERPPKKAHLRNAFNDRVPSPDLPPPSPPTVTEHEVLNCDDPLPPPPSELQNENHDGRESGERVGFERHKQQQQHPERQSSRRSVKHKQRDNIDSKQTNHAQNHVPKSSLEKNHFIRASSVVGVSKNLGDGKTAIENGVSAGFATHRMVATGRSSLRYPSTQKLQVNGRVAPAPVRRTSEDRLVFPARPPAQLPDLISQRYTDSGNQRPAPQVPVEPRIIRQESMRVEGSRLEASGLLRNDSQRLESSSGQRPQPQVPKAENRSQRPNYLPLLMMQEQKASSKYADNNHHNHHHHHHHHHHQNGTNVVNNNNNSNNNNANSPGSNFITLNSPVKTSYEASSKLFPEGSPQKYHEPPKYVPNSQRLNESPQRNYYALPPKYVETNSPNSQKPQPQTPVERFNTGSPGSPPPPPLAPRLNSGRKSLPPPPRPAPPHSNQQGSQSKASYLAYRRERGAPDSEGSYKRTMSPTTARLDDWPPLQRELHDDPVLLRVTPRHPHPLQNSDQHLQKSHSVDALHQRLQERAAHSVEVIGKLSYDLSKKLQASEVRSRNEANNNLHKDISETETMDNGRKERISPQSIEVLNDRNRQLEREGRKLAAGCERRVLIKESHTKEEAEEEEEEDYQDHDDDDDDNDKYKSRERSATIETTTSRNVQIAVINRRNFNNDNFEQRPPPVIEKPPPPTTSPPRTPEPGTNRSRSCSSSSSVSSASSSGSHKSPVKIEPTSSSPSDSPPVEKTINLLASSTRRKVSSPTQTDEQTRTNVVDESQRGSPNQAKYSQTVNSTSSYSSLSSSSSPSKSPDGSAPISTCNILTQQHGIEGLNLVQRTEIVLRVNAATTDAASQTDIISDVEDTDCDRRNNYELSNPEPRKKLPEEIECEVLSRDLASKLSPNDKLVPILVPAPEHKRPTDYVSGLFRVEATLQPRPRRRLSLSLQEETPPSPTASRSEDNKTETSSSTLSTPDVSASVPDPTSPLSPTSAYFTTSEGKARFLTRYSRDVTEENLPPIIIGSDDPSIQLPGISPVVDNQDLKQKKEELVVRLDRKLVVLRAEQEAVREEGEINEALGSRVTSRIAAAARPAEASKYRLHVEEVGKITSLLLGLSGRLARAENALYGMPSEHAERKILESKRDKLLDQLEEAKVLKNNIDKRSVNVSAILSKYLDEEDYADYQHFINMKAKLIMDAREIQDKVKLGEEQLTALKEAID